MSPNTPFRDDVYINPKQFPKIECHFSLVKKRAPEFKANEQIQIGLLICFAPRDGPKHANVGRPMTLSNR